MRKFPIPCLDCGKLSLAGNRCETCTKRVADLHEIKRAAVKRDTKQYSGAYRKKAADVRKNAIQCWICGEGARLDDPWQADHVNPGENGDDAVLMAAHASCNRKRGNKPAET